MSLFAGLEKLVSDEVDSVFGDEITVIPVARGEISSVPAEDQKYKLTGVVDFTPVTVKHKGKEGDDGFQPNLTGDIAHVSFKTAELESEGKPKSGDRFEVVLEGKLVALIAGPAHPDNLGRLVYVCRKQ
jgi:hypothetical protein